MDLLTIFGGLITFLLSIVAYFIRQLHSDFRRVEKDLTEVKTTTSLIKSEFKSGYDLLNQKVEFLEKRLENVERFYVSPSSEKKMSSLNPS
jgi:hypothetical protein